MCIHINIAMYVQSYVMYNWLLSYTVTYVRVLYVRMIAKAPHAMKQANMCSIMLLVMLITI